MDIKSDDCGSGIIDRIIDWLIQDYGCTLSERELGTALDHLLEDIPGFESQKRQHRIKKTIIYEYRRYGKDGDKS